MKAKYFLAFMVLPALFAACTNDDFETVQTDPIQNSVLKDRAQGELVLTASKTGGEADAQTRIVGETAGTGINWLWEDANDKIGATVVDYKDTKGTDDIKLIATTNDAYTITNYPFAPEINGPASSANFSTPTTVVEGAYLFYNRYDGDNTKRGQINATIDRIQTVNYGEEAGLKQVGTVENGGQNFFVSPILDLEIADGELYETPLQMSSAHSILRFTFKADLESKYLKNFEINKVVLEGKTNKKFNRTLTINPQAIAKIQAEIRDMVVDGKQPYKTWFKGNGAIVTKDANGEPVSEEQIKAAMQLVNDAISQKQKDGTLREIGKLTDNSQDLQFQLETPFIFNSNDDEMTLLVVVPSGKYTQEEFKEAYGEKKETKGLFALHVYTSEGIYNAYLNSYNEDGDVVTERTFERGKLYRMPEQTLIIKGGKTNITLFEQEEEFTVETTDDWNYTVEYINAHWRDYGDANEWNIPVVKLNPDNAEEGITVDADHYFPAYPVLYTGDAKLNLVGQDEYKFNPAHIIFATGADRPTLQVLEQPNAKVIFDYDINEDVEAENEKTPEDGKTITAAIKLVSDAQVVVKEGTTVQFEQLVNKGSFTVEADPDPDYEKYTQAILLKDATGSNEGTINVAGRFDASAMTADFTNAKDGIITVEGFENGMNDKARGIASFGKLINNGTIDIQASADKKGTYGGMLNVATLENNYASNGSKKGIINDNGEMKVTTEITSNGTITLGTDAYAMIQLAKGTLTDANGLGSLVLADAKNYEMYDAYYVNRSNINLNQVTGVIETTLTSQADYDKVIKDHNDYAVNTTDKQQSALQVLNLIRVDGFALDLSADKTLGTDTDSNFDGVTFFLNKDASLDVTNVSGKQIGSIYAIGANTAVTVANPKKDESTITAGAIVTTKDADLTIGESVTVNGVEAITLDGKLTNNGEVNTNTVTTAAPITTDVKATGSLINQGVIGTEAEAKDWDYTDDNIEALNILINLVNNVEPKSDTSVPGYYITNAGENEWDGDYNVTDRALRLEIINAWIAKGAGSTQNPSNYVEVDGVKYAIWRASGKFYSISGTTTDIENAIIASYNGDTDAANNKYTNIWSTYTREVEKDEFANDWNLHNYLDVTVNKGIVDMQHEDAVTYGVIRDNQGTKKGEFTQDYKNMFE